MDSDPTNAITRVLCVQAVLVPWLRAADMWVGGRDWMDAPFRPCVYGMFGGCRFRISQQKVASPSFLCNSAVWVQYNVPHMWTCGVRITPFFSYLKIVVKVFFGHSRICINPHVLGSIRVEIELNFLKPHQHMACSTVLFQQYFSHSSSA
jgi:hypothetical protein